MHQTFLLTVNEGNIKRCTDKQSQGMLHAQGQWNNYELLQSFPVLLVFFFCHASDCVTDLVFHIFILIRNFTLHQILSHKVMPSIHCSLKEKWHLFLWLRWVCTNRYIQVFHMQQQSSMLPWTTENNASESFFCLCLCILFSYLYLKY